MKIGIVIADEMEFRPFKFIDGADSGTLFGDEYLRFTYKSGENAAEITAVLCGIGKVNAAAATAHLIAGGAEIILNSGLSGGISGVRRGDITLGTKYVEHDFDLTPLKFAPAEKPGQTWIYEADPMLYNIFRQVCPTVDGPAVCGDGFIAEEEKKLWLRDSFGAVSCDMESAACASVCYKAGVPFLAIRRISDDASDGAGESYREMNDKAEADLAEILFSGIENMIKCN